MKKTKQIFRQKKKNNNFFQKYPSEEQLFIHSNRYQKLKNKNNRNNCIYIFIIIISILLLIILISLIKIITKPKKNQNQSFIRKENIQNVNNSTYNNIYNINNAYNNKNTDETIEPIDSRFIDMLPRLFPDVTKKPSSLKEIFNARQLYIPDTRITPEYIRYVRPVNETEVIKYQKRYSPNETIIDTKIYDKRVDQLNYVDFCKICLDEQLINKAKIEYNNKPIISIVIPSYNKKNFLVKSVRSIQNQNFQNIEIIIVNDASTDNSTGVFNYLLESDPRIRIFHHMSNMGCWRTRLDGITYSRGDYIILFDAGDLYEDNYVLTDAYNIIQKYNLDSCKFLFRVIRSFNYPQYSRIFFHVGNNAKIIYEPENIKAIDVKIFTNWGNIWNRLVRANIYSKAFHLLNDLMLNIHKNVWDDLWFNHIIRRASYSYAVYERVGYVYLQDGRGEGSPKSRSEEEKSKIVKEYVGFLYYDYTFKPKNESIPVIMEKLRDYNESHASLRLQNFREHFEVLNNLLEALVKDDYIIGENKTFVEGLLKESKQREEIYTGKK